MPRYSVFPFGTDFTGGVRVAAGDVTGDGVADLIAAPGAGGGPVVKVFDGVTGAELRSQFVFEESFRGGLYVAAGDTDLDGRAEVIAGAGEGGGPAVVVIDGATGAVGTSFFAFGDGFRGGVRVAAGDVDGDGRADVIAGAGPGGAPHVRAVSVAAGGRELASFYAYDAAFAGGVFVAAADLDRDNRADLVTGTGAGGGPLVNGFRADGTRVASFLAADGGLRTGVRVGVAYNGYDGDLVAVVPGAGVGRFTPAGQALPSTGLSGGWVGGPAEAAPDAAMLWNQVALHAITIDGTPPPAAARALAMTHLGVYTAVNAVGPPYYAYAPYLFNPGASPGADREAAALIAGERVLSALFPELADDFVRVRDARLALIPDGTPKDAGLEAGAKAAAFIVAVRSFDGSTLRRASRTLPSGAAATGGRRRRARRSCCRAGAVQPFAIPSAVSFRPAGPPAVTSPEYAADLNAVQQLGRVDSTARTADQTAQALFWGSGANINLVAQAALRRLNLNLLDSARAFALVNLATADAGIAAWDAKLTYDRWRPVTAVREADTDGNGLTTADPTWAPLRDTPNHPDYVAEQAAFAGAGAAVLEWVFGPGFAVRTYSPGLPGVSRAFADFAGVAAEVAASEVYAGVHTPTAAADGLAVGQAVGTFVATTQLQQPG